MRTIDIPGKRLGWRALAIVAMAAALTLLVADAGVAKKKKPFKTGTYSGKTSQALHNGVQLDVKKKKVTVVFFDFYTGCGVPMCEPSFAGLEAGIKVKKVGSIAFEPGKRKRVGTFDVDGPGDDGFVIGYIKGKKAEGIASRGATGPDVDWTAERTGPSFFSD